MIAIGLGEKERKEMANRLNVLLSNEFVLYAKTLKFHWNVVGKWFGPLHALFEKQYEQILDIVDEVAERVRALDHVSFGTMQEYLAHTTLKETPGKNPDDTGMLRELLNDHETIIKQLRGDIAFSSEVNDMGSNNFLSELIEHHEKTAWILRAHLQG